MPQCTVCINCRDSSFPKSDSCSSLGKGSAGNGFMLPRLVSVWVRQKEANRQKKEGAEGYQDGGVDWWGGVEMGTREWRREGGWWELCGGNAVAECLVERGNRQPATGSQE